MIEAYLKDTKITVLNDQVFNSCDNLSKIVFPDELLIIENSAFSYCISLEEITLPDVEYLGTNPDSVTWFGNIFDNSMPNNLYLPYVEEPTDTSIKDKWNKFLGYSWSGKIRYKTPMPVN